MTQLPPYQLHVASGVRPRAALALTPGEPLMWTQPDAFKRAWRLDHAGRKIAELWHRRWYGQSLVAESPSGSWTLRVTWTGVIELVRDGETEWAARYEPRLWGTGQIRLAKGDSFRARRHMRFFRSSIHEIVNDSEFALLRAIPRFRFLHLEGTIEVEDIGRRHPEIEALILMIWAIALRARRRSHAH